MNVVFSLCSLALIEINPQFAKYSISETFPEYWFWFKGQATPTISVHISIVELAHHEKCHRYTSGPFSWVALIVGILIYSLNIHGCLNLFEIASLTNELAAVFLYAPS